MSQDDIAIIDAHHHIWELGHGHHPWLEGDHDIAFRYGDYTTLKRDYGVEDYLADHGPHQIVKSIYMEAEWDPRDPLAETRYIHAVHERTGWPHAMVGQIRFERADVADVLAGHASFPLVRSVRQKPKAAPSPDTITPGAPGSMGHPDFRQGYRLLGEYGLHYDLQTPWWHLDEALALARDFPGTHIILNHTGLPADRSEAGLVGWREAMARLSDAPNVAVKISGIGVPGRAWTVELQRGVVLETVSLFGAERCMVGSNFPVDRLCAGFDEIFSGLKAITADLAESERRALFHDTAQRIYRPL